MDKLFGQAVWLPCTDLSDPSAATPPMVQEFDFVSPELEELFDESVEEPVDESLDELLLAVSSFLPELPEEDPPLA